MKDTFNHPERTEVCRGTSVDAEDLLSVPNHSGQITWQHHLQDKGMVAIHISQCWICREQSPRSGGLSTNVKAHLTVPSGKNCSQNFPVLLHLVKLPLQRALHVGICHHILYNVFLQRSPECSLVGAVKFKPVKIGHIQTLTLSI